MNILEKLVAARMKRLGLSRSALAARLGYRNINKGLRRIDAFLKNPDQDSILSGKLTGMLGISEGQVARAVEDARQANEEERRRAFKPFIQITLTKPPSPIIVAALFPGLTRIALPASVLELPYDEELAFVRGLYRAHRDQYSPWWPAGEGFCYFRRYDQALSFDREGCLLAGHQCRSYVAEIRL